MADNTDCTDWQVAAGSDGRNYADAFLRHGIAFFSEDFSDRAKEVKSGDKIILKEGKTYIVAVGTIREENGSPYGHEGKPWLKDFDGWDLSFYIHVDWHRLPEKKEVKGLSIGTIQRTHYGEVHALDEKVLKDDRLKVKVKEKPDPRDTNELEKKEINRLLASGAFERIHKLADHYYRTQQWGDVREHETRTFLVVPLLIALGWPESHIKVELSTSGRKRIDIACFSKPYGRAKDGTPNNDDCTLIIETKGFTQGLSHAQGQAEDYAESFPSCRTTVVTNGYCYKAFTKTNGSFGDSPAAYLNLRHPRDAYPVSPDETKGCVELLRLLLPPVIP